MEFNEEAFSFMKQNNFLSLIQEIFEEKRKNGENTKPLLEKLGDPELTKAGKLYQTKILNSVKSMYPTKGRETRFLQRLVVKLFQERREAYFKKKLESKPTEKEMKLQKRVKNSESETETPEKKMKLLKRKYRFN